MAAALSDLVLGHQLGRSRRNAGRCSIRILALLGAEFFILPAGNGCIVGRLAGYGARVQEPS